MPITDCLRIRRARTRTFCFLLAGAQASLCAAAPTDDVLLYDQSDVSMLGGASPTQQMGFANDEIADDFEVTGPGSWTISEVVLSLVFTDPDSTPPGQPPYLIVFYPDQNGVPSDTAACEYDAAPGVYDDTLPGASLNVTVTLPTPCTLAAGRYWMAISVVLSPPPYSLWTFNAPSSFIGNQPVYRNPDNHWGTGCIDWTPAYTGGCLFSFSGSPNMVFQIVGTAETPDEIFSDGFES